MTTDSSPAVTDEEPPAKAVLNQLRAPIAFTLLGVCGAWLLLALVVLAIPGASGDFSSRAASASSLIFGAVPIVLPVFAVLIVMTGRPALDKLRDPVLFAALAEYGLLVLLGLVVLVGMLLSDALSVRGILAWAVEHLAWFALIGIAAFVVVRLFLVTRPPKAPAPFANYAPLQDQGYPPSQPGQYGQPQPGQQQPGQALQPHNGAPAQPGQYGAPQQPYRAQQPYGQPQQQPYGQPGQYPGLSPQQVPYSPSQGPYTQQPYSQPSQPAGYGQSYGQPTSGPPGAPQSGPPAYPGQQPASGPPAYPGQQPASGPPAYPAQQPASGPPAYPGQPGGYAQPASPFPAAAPTQASTWVGFPENDENENQTQIIPPDLRQQADEARLQAEQERPSGWGQPPQS